MRPVKPKYEGSVKVEWKISKRGREIIAQYSKYTKYDESELVDMILSQILDDEEFVAWLKSRRYQQKINELILKDLKGLPKEEIESLGEVISDEEAAKDCPFE
ncbi:hypothetical protein [Desulfitobacterium metallireducens]|uniref:Uncharacterized protein n=1 Tax=Desulfitobacterium metallireducens DSM 15288 TaxID=871968 RepID=W0EB00_9FIRM|nr:hypothetical protein [Desulfitobacterium metallireducens]AHF07947.1 hypothetical protein DESME_13600 [Desulfitobacterium metallireducens DSM 15288]